MAATKGYATFTWASGSATASGTTNAISTSAYYSAAVYVKVVVVGTPTGSFNFTIQQSPDGTNFYSGQTFSAPLAAGTYYYGPPFLTLDPSTESVQIVYTAQSGGTSSTLTAQISYVSAF